MNDLPVVSAWHFVGTKLRDGRAVPADGEWLEHEGPLEMCSSGLHASRHPFDALQYATESTLCRVEIDGEIVEDRDKLVASRRRILARMNFEPQLAAFARWCALQVIHLWDAPEVVRRYLETGDEALRNAAREAALASVKKALGDAEAEAALAACAAAFDPKVDAVLTAKIAARDARSATLSENAKGPASISAEAAQRAEFNRLVTEAFGDVLQGRKG